MRERGLRLKHPQASVLACAGHLDALGYRITRHGVSARPRTLARMARRIGVHLVGQAGPEIVRSMASTAGVVLF